MTDMRIAVASICLNESKHIQRWAESASEADLLILGDTGSTDDSVDMAQTFGVEVVELSVRPWRFDVARNALLSAIPADIDIVVNLDCDEVLSDDWRDHLEYAATTSPQATRFSYTYAWSHTEDGRGDLMFDGDKCHSREGWMWKGAVHEVLTPSGMVHDKRIVPAGFRVDHWPDGTKSRASYLALLELAVHEEPHNPRQRYYLGREYFLRGKWDNARTLLMEYLKMPEAEWPAERASAWRYIAKMDNEPERWLLRAVAEDSGRREGWVDLAEHYTKESRPVEAAGAAARALSITSRSGDYLSEARAWDDEKLRDMMARAGLFI